MAYIKILVIHNRLDKCVDYTQDEEKTSLEAAIDYALNREKTERTCFETAVNCDRERVYQDMMDTKRRWGKADRRRKGYIITADYIGDVSRITGGTVTYTAVFSGSADAQEQAADQPDNAEKGGLPWLAAIPLCAGVGGLALDIPASATGNPGMALTSWTN